MTRPLGVILAGGRATRMGGGDKGLLPLGQGTILAHVVARLGPQVATLALNANGDPARFAELGLPVLADADEARAGPLAGVLAGLDWAAGQGAEAIVTAAADTPFLPRDLVAAARRRGVALGPRARRHRRRGGADRPASDLRPLARRPARGPARRARRRRAQGRRSGPTGTGPEPRSSTIRARSSTSTPRATSRPRGRCWQRAGEALGRHRLEERRQDRADGAPRRRVRGARTDRLDAEARAPRVRRRPARQGQPPPPRRRRDRGAGVFGRALGADARAARRGRAAARGAAGADVARRPGPGRGLEARPSPQGRGVPAGHRQPADRARRPDHPPRRLGRAVDAGPPGAAARRHARHRRLHRPGTGAVRPNFGWGSTRSPSSTGLVATTPGRGRERTRSGPPWRAAERWASPATCATARSRSAG